MLQNARKRRRDHNIEKIRQMINIAYYPGYRVYLQNQGFNINHPLNLTGNLDKWAALKQFLEERNISINTYDMYQDFKKIDIWLIEDAVPDRFKFLLKHCINPRSIIFMLMEPPVVNPWGWRYLKYYSCLFKAILTWNSELTQKHKKFFHYHFPQRFDRSKHSYYNSKRKRNLCVMVHSNKLSSVPGELYSFRRDIIRYFEKRGDSLLELYGYGWNDEKSSTPFFTNLYKGTTPDKKETFSEYYFTFCIDNSVVPGYITYDPLIAMSTGSVPIYLPMPDSLKYIPGNTFININDFSTLDELVLYLQDIINTNRYEEYRHNGWEFINSERYFPFTIEKFCEDIFKAISILTTTCFRF